MTAFHSTDLKIVLVVVMQNGAGYSQQWASESNKLVVKFRPLLSRADADSVCGDFADEHVTGESSMTLQRYSRPSLQNKEAVPHLWKKGDRFQFVSHSHTAAISCRRHIGFLGWHNSLPLDAVHGGVLHQKCCCALSGSASLQVYRPTPFPAVSHLNLLRFRSPKLVCEEFGLLTRRHDPVAHCHPRRVVMLRAHDL